MLCNAWLQDIRWLHSLIFIQRGKVRLRHHNVIIISTCTDELDSYMFQTVGHEAVELVAQAMGLPLYRIPTSGWSKRRGLQYEEQEGDEVEDLFELLQLVQRSERVEGVASGAVLSDYQRLRMEHVYGFS